MKILISFALFFSLFFSLFAWPDRDKNTQRDFIRTPCIDEAARMFSRSLFNSRGRLKERYHKRYEAAIKGCAELFLWESFFKQKKQEEQDGN